MNSPSSSKSDTRLASQFGDTEALHSAGIYDQPETASRTHAPDLEQWAFNQMPKTIEWREPRLYRYDGTDLYQWYAKRRDGYSVFEDAFGEPFLIRPLPALPSGDTYPKLRDLLLGLRAPGGTMHLFKANCEVLAAELGQLLSDDPA